MIGGNIRAELQVKTSSTRNQIGEVIPQWQTVHTLIGFIDYQSGDSKYSTYDAKIQESTHIFIGNYVPLNSGIKAENCRMIINNKHYDVLLIDNPMELNKHLEIYLKYTGD